MPMQSTAKGYQTQIHSHVNNNNNEYLEHLTHKGPKRLQVLYKCNMSTVFLDISSCNYFPQ